MKRTVAIFITLSFSVLLSAAQQAPTQQLQTIQMECRDFGPSGSYLSPNETLIDGRACHPVTAAQSGAASSSALKPASTPVSSAVSSVPPPTATPPPASDGKIRVFVTDSQSWETRGGSSAGGNGNAWGAHSWIAGGARPQTAEIIKTLNQRCPELTVTNNTEKADFVLTLDHEGGKGLLAHRNKIAVFNRDGDDIFSDSTRELGNSVKDACQAILASAAKR